MTKQLEFSKNLRSLKAGREQTATSTFLRDSQQKTLPKLEPESLRDFQGDPANPTPLSRNLESLSIESPEDSPEGGKTVEQLQPDRQQPGIPQKVRLDSTARYPGGAGTEEEEGR